MNGLSFTDSTEPFNKDSSELEALKLRTDYAWKWFSYHAGQRTSMFNYSLIVIGILANAYVTAVKEGMVVPAIVIAALGAIMCGAFVMLDLRNKRLVNMGEDMLQYLEKRQLFTLDSTTDGTHLKEGLLNRSKTLDIKDESKGIRKFCCDAV